MSGEDDKGVGWHNVYVAVGDEEYVCGWYVFFFNNFSGIFVKHDHNETFIIVHGYALTSAFAECSIFLISFLFILALFSFPLFLVHILM